MPTTIEIRTYRDRTGRLWLEIPGDEVAPRLRHDFPPENAPAPVPGWPLREIAMERVVVEYLVGPLEEV